MGNKRNKSIPKKASRRIAKAKKVITAKKRCSRQRQKEMAMANLRIIAPLPRFWASTKTCTPLPKCSAPNTSFDKATRIFVKEIVSIVLVDSHMKQMLQSLVGI